MPTSPTKIRSPSAWRGSGSFNGRKATASTRKPSLASCAFVSRMVERSASPSGAALYGVHRAVHASSSVSGAPLAQAIYVELFDGRCTLP